MTTYSVTNCEVVSAGFDRVLVRLPGRNRTLAISEFEKAALSTCSYSGTFQQLTRHAIENLGLSMDQAGAVMNIFRKFKDIGLLAPVGDVSKGAEENFHQPAIQLIAFPTADRPQLLQRALQSFIDHFRTCDRQVEWLVMDDSRSNQGPLQSMEAVANACKAEEAVRWAGYVERKNYVKELLRIGVDPDAANFALLGAWRGDVLTTGANRNAILLDTIGTRLLSVDDDMICRLAIHPQRSNSLCLQGHVVPRDYWFFEDHSKALSFARWDRHCNLLAEHEALLGKTLTDLGKEFADDTVVQNPCRHLLGAIAQPMIGRVLVTIAGVVGDCGLYALPFEMYVLRSNLQRLEQEKRNGMAAMTSRQIFAVSKVRTITHNSFFQCGTAGLANEVPLPPFFPVGRNQDGLFGMFLHLMAPSAWIGHIPVALLHEPDSLRTYSRALQFRISEFVWALVARLTPAHRLGSIDFLRYAGKELLYISSIADCNFWDYVATSALSFEAERLRYMHTLFKKFPTAPPFWSEAINITHDKLLHGVTQADSFVPLEFRTGLSSCDARQRTRELVRLLGKLMTHWTTLLSAARTLQQRGIRVSRELT